MTLPPASAARGLRVDGVSKQFGRRKALDNVSLTVQPGEIVALLGPNGSGKSTLFNILTGIEQADRGAVLIDGIDVTALPAFGRARFGMAYLPQEPSSFRGLSVEDNLRLVIEGCEPDAQRRERRIADLLAMFELTGLATRKPAALSGGQRRRCEMARALASEPRYLLVDEPFAKLDPIHIAAFSDMMRRLSCGDTGIAPGILICDHNIRATLALAKRAVILVSGVMIASASSESILTDPRIRNAILSPDSVI
jgi:lipopolysaccharide export system ATP-binding protein